MSIKGLLLNGVINAIKSRHPEVGPLIDLAIKYEPQIEKLVPVVNAAVKEGPGAFAAAAEKAPELSAAIRTFVASMPRAATTHVEADRLIGLHSEQLTRQIFGAPALSPEQERDWMERAAPYNDPSRENSNVGSG